MSMFVFCVVGFILILTILVAFDEIPFPWRVCIGLAVIIAAANMASYSKLPGTDATRKDVIEMINECETDLPRTQNCVIDIMVRPE